MGCIAARVTANWFATVGARSGASRECPPIATTVGPEPSLIADRSSPTRLVHIVSVHWLHKLHPGSMVVHLRAIVKGTWSSVQRVRGDCPDADLQHRVRSAAVSSKMPGGSSRGRAGIFRLNEPTMSEGSRSRHTIDDRRWRRDLGAIVVVLVLVNLANAFLLDGWSMALVQTMAAVLAIAAARSVGYSRADLGLARNDLAAGLRLGGTFAVVVVVAVTVIAALPFTTDFFADDRFNDLTPWDTAFEVGVRIPIVTAFAEEAFFRSVLLAVLLVATSTWRAVLASSLMFGLWHIFTTIGDLDDNRATAEMSVAGAVGAVVGVVVVTGGAGIVFAWLRLRSGSLVAPWLVHSALNASTFMAGAVLAS